MNDELTLISEDAPNTISVMEFTHDYDAVYNSDEEHYDDDGCDIAFE